jgi:hypothetical protein
VESAPVAVRLEVTAEVTVPLLRNVAPLPRVRVLAQL